MRTQCRACTTPRFSRIYLAWPSCISSGPSMREQLWPCTLAQESALRAVRVLGVRMRAGVPRHAQSRGVARWRNADAPTSPRMRHAMRNPAWPHADAQSAVAVVSLGNARAQPANGHCANRSAACTGRTRDGQHHPCHLNNTRMAVRITGSTLSIATCELGALWHYLTTHELDTLGRTTPHTSLRTRSSLIHHTGSPTQWPHDRQGITSTIVSATTERCEVVCADNEQRLACTAYCVAWPHACVRAARIDGLGAINGMVARPRASVMGSVARHARGVSNAKCASGACINL